MKVKHTTIRLSDEAKERLARYASDYSSQTVAIEDALAVWEGAKVAFGQQVARVTSALINAIRSEDERAIGGAQIKLAELLHNSLPAAMGIAAAIREDVNASQPAQESDKE